MPEAGETSVEIAHKLCEKNEKKVPRSSRHEFYIEILEATILALVAVSTAYSGYQVAQWNGQQAELYAEANTINIKASSLITLDGEEALYNTNTLNCLSKCQNAGK